VLLVSSLVADMLAFRQRNALIVISMKDAKDVVSLKCPENHPICTLAFTLDGKTLAMVSDGLPNAETQPDKPPAFGEKLPMTNDGKGSTVLLFDLKTSRQTGKHELWYSADDAPKPVAGFVGENLVILNYNNTNARISPKGEIEMFKIADLIGYGSAISPDGKKFGIGSMIQIGRVRDAATGKDAVITGAKPNPDFPEYYDEMVFDAKGGLYGLTNHLRIFKIDDKFVMVPIQAVY
jgi:hypothetical protein